MAVVYISLGSNMGKRRENCLLALDKLGQAYVGSLTGVSAFYLSQPVDCPRQNWFVNAAVRLETRLDPFALLDQTKRIETQLGRRINAVRFGPRIIDLDIVLYDDQILDMPELTIPHPRMHKRRFVLQPICDIDDRIIHPVFKEPLTRLLAGIPESGQKLIRIT
ncbi:MAG: 2-amino-4-hydroxy-6-hydroxymethyldihydropteridine diphosphokinase [Desulfobacterales bacterium]